MRKRSFVKFVVLIICFLIVVSPTFGQKKKNVSTNKQKTIPPCQLTNAPTMRGFYLGQTVDEITKIVPDFREAYELQRKDREMKFSLTDWNTEIDATISAELELVYIDSGWAFGQDSERKLLNSSDYEDVHVIWWFKNEKLFGFGVYYDELEIDQDAEKFVKQVTAKTTLPQKGWKIISMGLEAELKCDGFKVFLNSGYKNSPHLIFTDTKTETEIVRLEKEIKIRKKKEEIERIRLEKEKRGTFKP
jgi:hypothetical protein